MRILVLSDSHGRASRLEEIIEAQSTAKELSHMRAECATEN